MYTTAKLVKIEQDSCITKDAYANFMYEFQIGILLSLKEDGKLTQMQYRHAEEILKEQRINILRSEITGGNNN